MRGGGGGGKGPGGYVLEPVLSRFIIKFIHHSIGNNTKQSKVSPIKKS